MRQDDKPSLLGRPGPAAAFASLCALLWGSAYPGIKAGYELFAVGADDTPAKLVFAGVRFALAGALVLLFRLLNLGGLRGAGPAKTVAPSRGASRFTPADFLLIASLGLAQTAVNYYFFYVGLSYTSGAKGSIMNSTTVFFSALLAHLVYRNDKLSPRKAAGVFLGFLGVVLVNYRRGIGLDFALRGEGFVMISALILSATAIYSKRITNRLEPVLVSGGQLLIGGLALTAAGLAMGAPFLSGGLSAWLVLGYLALLSSVSFTLWTALLKHNKVSSISVFNFIIPVAGTGLSALFLGESVWQLRYLLALPAVALGIFLVNGAESRRNRVKTAAS